MYHIYTDMPGLVKPSRKKLGLPSTKASNFTMAPPD